MRNGDKIIHMVPAAGYYAAYQHGDEVTYNPVAAWIVLEDQQGRQRVDGRHSSLKERGLVKPVGGAVCVFLPAVPPLFGRAR